MGLGGFSRVFWDHLPAVWGGHGPFRAQSIKFVSSPALGFRNEEDRSLSAKHLARRQAALTAVLDALASAHDSPVEQHLLRHPLFVALRAMGAQLEPACLFRILQWTTREGIERDPGEILRNQLR
jgi:hypothetical protein